MFILRQLQENAGNKENHCSSPLLIWQRPLILWAGNLSKRYWKKIGCPPIPLQLVIFFTRTWMHVLRSMEIHQSFKVRSGAVSWHPLSLSCTLLPSFNMHLMGTRMEFTSEPDLMDLFSIWKDWSRNDWWLQCWLENCALLLLLR